MSTLLALSVGQKQNFQEVQLESPWFVALQRYIISESLTLHLIVTVYCNKVKCFVHVYVYSHLDSKPHAKEKWLDAGGCNNKMN